MTPERLLRIHYSYRDHRNVARMKYEAVSFSHSVAIRREAGLV